MNDNGRSYAPTIGAFAQHLAKLRLRPGYERVLGSVKHNLPRVPVVGPPFYEALHGMKRGMKDMLAPQGMFEDLGLKYVGPVDGHDVAAVENALRARSRLRRSGDRARGHPEGLRLSAGRERSDRSDAPVAGFRSSDGLADSDRGPDLDRGVLR